ncbi:S-layer homology domain-containing protein [Paenibacillus sp. VCA1]|uniref:S-layer homology domain-containing protein n=1 Tax=Paenibacillus sp. VCA1 TaxID=3039148 RepID=UPI00287104EC|nr:S-layer homology domain-containing protein [Paenibacillus sp. VCA1]MDR9854640.1 S-layer homology domain-containing protein [Paenibacillus sp. VCA1]
MKRFKKTAAALIAFSCLAAASSAYAFSDIKDPKQEKIAASLQSQGIIHGVSADRFAPAQPLTAAQGVQLLVKAMKLQAKVDGPPPPANVPAKAWFAQAAAIAADNGISVSNIRDWNMNLTRERFAGMLTQAVKATGEYPTTEMYMLVKDEDETAPEYRAGLQFLLLTGITELDAQNRFHPKQNITRMEAAEMIYNALQFIQSHKSQDPGQAEDDVSIRIEKVNDQVNKIVLSKPDMPNPGYGLAVDRIEFLSGQKAVAYYHITTPAPGKMYPQVISTATASFYLDSKFEISVKKTPGYDGGPISAPGTGKTIK